MTWIVLVTDAEYGTRTAYGPYDRVEQAYDVSVTLRQRDNTGEYDYDVLRLQR